MTNDTQKRERTPNADEVLRRMLAMPPHPHKTKLKKKTKKRSK